MINEHPLLPSNDLPPLRFPANQTLEWLEHTEDSQENYRKARRNSAYGEHDIIYSFNRLGYRSIAFDVEASIRIVAIGCSYVMGVGMRQEDLFHEIVAQELRKATGEAVAVLNLGAPGGSNDYIARLLHLAVPILDPTVILINFTHASRREYVSAKEDLLTYVPGYKPYDGPAREIYRHLDALTSPADNDLNLFRNYKGIEALLRDRLWLFSSISSMDISRIGEHVDLLRYVGAMPQIDRARDGCHPGPESHRALATRYWEHFVAHKSLERLPPCLPTRRI